MGTRRLFLIAALPLPAFATELDINSASRARLEQLDGLGPPMAERILAARAEAPFADWADLRKRVKGIGPKLARKLADQGLRVNGLSLPSSSESGPEPDAAAPPDPPASRPPSSAS